MNTHSRREYRGKTSYVGVFSTRRPQLLVTDPEVIKHILIKDFKNFNANEFSDQVYYRYT